VEAAESAALAAWGASAEPAVWGVWVEEVQAARADGSIWGATATIGEL